MTTIAVTKGVIAYDSRVADDDVAHPDVIQKVWVSKKHPAAYCGYGTVSEWWPLTQYLDGLNKLPWDQKKWKNTDAPDIGDSGLMVVTGDGRIYFFEGKNWYPAKEGWTWYACGTGTKAALGAMLAGASARQAVEIAIKLDPYSGPPVKTLKIADIGLTR